eukprot:scaffold9068_cov350-Chaetoceros_neogracile.AAC.5
MAYPGLEIDVEEQLQYYISISERVNSMTVDTIQYTNDAYPNNIPVCGWLDIPQMQYSCLINGCTAINLTKLDVLTGLDEFQLCDISNCKKFEDLPDNAQKYVLRVQELLGVPIRWIEVGHNRSDQIDRGEGWDLK